jgi:outer membrane immunogenic protein
MINYCKAAAIATLMLGFAAQSAAADGPAIWTGIYLGGHVGGVFGTDDYSSNGGLKFDINGFAGGIHGGYNFPVARNVVGGVEADVSWSGADGSKSFASPPDTVTVTSAANYLASVRGRLGLASDNMLFYATAGVAWSEIDLKSALVGPISGTVQTSTTSTGFVVGGGIEAKLSNNLSGRVEGLYYGFGDESLGFSGLPSVKVSRDVTAIRAGLSYHFN